VLIVLNPKLQPVGILSNESPSACPYFDDEHTENIESGVHTYEFSIPSTHENSNIVEVNGFIIVRDLDGNHLLFTIKQIEEVRGDEGHFKHVYCELTAIDDLLGYAVRPVKLNSQTLESALNYVLAETDYELGQVDFLGSEDFDFSDYITVLEAVRTIAERFGAEVYFTVELTGTTVTKKLLHAVERRGQNTGKRFEYSKDLADVKRIEDSTRVVTALIGVGKGDSNGKRITLANYVPDASLNVPSYIKKDYAVDYIEHTEAFERWNRNGRHIFGIFIDDEAETQYELFKSTMAELERLATPLLNYEMNVVSLERLTGYEANKVRIGDTIIVKDTTFNPVLVVEARVIELKRSYTDPMKDVVVLGEYRPIQISIPQTVIEIQKKISLNEEKWNESGLSAEEVTTIVETRVQPVEQTANDALNTANEANQAVTEVHAIAVNAQDTANQALAEVQFREIAIPKQPTPPYNPKVNDLWIDTSVTPNVLKRYDGSAWVKITPTSASEVGAIDTTTFNNQVTSLTNSIAQKADLTYVNGQLALKENAITKSSTAPSNPTTNQLWLDTSVTPNVLKRWNGSAWVKVTPTSAGEVGAYTKTEVDNALNSKVSVTQYNADINGIVTQLDDHESRITQTENEIATKVSQTTYNQDKTALQNDIAELETRMSNAETAITQNANEIALKANKTDVYTKTEVDNALSGKADDSRVDTLETRVSNAEAQLTVQAGQIATKVSQTEFTQELAKKENSVIKSSTAPSNPTTDMLWLDTSVTPNVLKRWNGSSWVKATPTTAGEVGAYTKSETDSKLATKANQSDLNTLTTRVSTAETNITQLSNQISLKANASDVYTKSQVDASLATKANQADLDEVSSDVANLETRMSNAEAQLTVQANEIATKVSQTEFTQQLATKANASDVYTKSDIQVLSANNLIHNSEWKTDASSWTLSSGWTRDTSRTFQGSNTMKVDVSGLSSDAWRALYSEYVTVSAGQELVASGYTFTDNMNTIDRGASLEIEWFDANNTRISTVSVSVKPTANNTWQRFSITGVAPTGTVKARIRFHPVRNGRFWVARPMLQYGKIPTAFTPHVDELATNIVTRLSNAESSITQQANQIALKVDQAQYNIDLSNLNARLSSAESTLTIQAGQISSKVDVNGVISAINQSAEQIKIQASKIALDGYVEARHIKSLNGLNINNKFIVDASGNVSFAGTLSGASGTFYGTVQVTAYDGVTGGVNTITLDNGEIVSDYYKSYGGGVYVNKQARLNNGGIELFYKDVMYELDGEGTALIYNDAGRLVIEDFDGGIDIYGGDLSISVTSDVDISASRINTYSNIYMMAGTGIYSTYYGGRNILFDHNNGNVTLSAVGSDLFLGYWNTNYIRSQREHWMMAGGRVKAGSWIVEAGNLDATNGIVLGGAFKFTSINTTPVSGDGVLWYGNGFSGKGLYLYKGTGWVLVK
jgi:phage minor structural protein